MRWTTYSFAMLAFSVVGGLLTYALLRLQGILPLNPQHFTGKDMTPDLSFNTAMSFITNTNWQSYTPEQTVSYFSNMVALAMHNWMSAATGIAVAIAIVRGFARHSVNVLGNFWVDMTRATLYVLLPICFVYAIFLVWQGCPQNFHPYTQAVTLENAKQPIAQGPVASQEAIKMLGTNGGGFFNANSAHPYENPTPLSNLVQMLSIFLIPAGLTYTFGKMVGNTKQGWALFAAMAIMFAGGLTICYWAEAKGNPNVARLGVMSQATADQPGGNMEGKETRFGISASALFATVTTDASCGAVNSMHDSFTPIGGAVPMVNLMCDETIFGGVGAGLYGMLMYAVVAVFIAGLMVGRTPEYVGKKIEKVRGANGDPGCSDPVCDGRHSLRRWRPIVDSAGQSWNHVNNSSPSVFHGGTYNNVNNAGAHGFSEILYAYASAVGQQRLGFRGHYGQHSLLQRDPGHRDTDRPVSDDRSAAGDGRKPGPQEAGSRVRRHPGYRHRHIRRAAGRGRADSGALEYFPALALGPVVDHFHMIGGKLF